MITLEYGNDVNESKKLIDKLNISKFVEWLPLMPRKELMVGLSMSDIGIAALKDSTLIYGTVFEILSMSVPLMMNRNDINYNSQHKTLYPILNVKNETDVSQIFTDYMSNKGKYKIIGEEGFKWLRENQINKPLKKIVELINQK